MTQNYDYAIGTRTRIRPVDSAVPGIFIQRNLTKEAINLAGETAQVLSLKLASATPSTEYSVTVNGFTVTFTTPATIAMPDLQALLLRKLQVVPEVSGSFVLAASGTDSVALTAVEKGVSYTAIGTALISVAETTPAMSAKSIACGTIVTARPDFVGGLQVCGAPSAATEKAIGATQYSHGGIRNIGESDVTMFDRGDTMSLVVQGQGWMEFESMSDGSVPGSLYYRSVPSPASPRTGRLVYASTAPVGFVKISGSLDSETMPIADGRIVGLVTLSLL
jgi:hypothetical protein